MYEFDNDVTYYIIFVSIQIENRYQLPNLEYICMNMIREYSITISGISLIQPLNPVILQEIW